MFAWLYIHIKNIVPNCGSVVLLESRLGGCDWPRPSHSGMEVMLIGSPPVPSGRGSREAELRGSASANVGGNPCLTYSIATASTCSLASAAEYYICTIEKNKLISIAGLIMRTCLRLTATDSLAGWWKSTCSSTEVLLARYTHKHCTLYMWMYVYCRNLENLHVSNLLNKKKYLQQNSHFTILYFF